MTRRLFGLALIVLATGAVLGTHWLGNLASTQRLTVPFARGTELTAEGRTAIERAVVFLTEHPRHHASVVGHSGTLGDADSNRLLSQQRAEAVADRLIAAGIDRARLTTAGIGGSEPLPRRDDEPTLAYQGRLARVVVTLVHPAPWN
ncbi:OmpA family protein [Roseospirillum parvum]|uniref:OmpA family protein n=1 Tax=Roseospirillum parvum TaxID=83401 RepID=A0A1G7UXX2_9PROT|nr:OmpA family protein [Roseospirillum parvum]SDG52346.1 OmpA family protein [Roseospirillum parvum]